MSRKILLFDGLFSSANWIKVNISPVCFGARDNSYGVFKIPITGQVISFKLVYRSGYLNCVRASRHRSNWGCKALRPPRNLAVFITDHLKKRILPTSSALFRNMRNPCATGIFYSVPGVTSDSPELGFNNFSSPMTVTVGQEFQIWYGEDLTNCTEQDNKGHTCADIYGLYL